MKKLALALLVSSGVIFATNASAYTVSTSSNVVDGNRMAMALSHAAHYLDKTVNHCQAAASQDAGRDIDTDYLGATPTAGAGDDYISSLALSTDCVATITYKSSASSNVPAAIDGAVIVLSPFTDGAPFVAASDDKITGWTCTITADTSYALEASSIGGVQTDAVGVSAARVSRMCSASG